MGSENQTPSRGNTASGGWYSEASPHLYASQPHTTSRQPPRTTPAHTAAPGWAQRPWIHLTTSRESFRCWRPGCGHRCCVRLLGPLKHQSPDPPEGLGKYSRGRATPGQALSPAHRSPPPGPTAEQDLPLSAERGLRALGRAWRRGRLTHTHTEKTKQPPASYKSRLTVTVGSPRAQQFISGSPRFTDAATAGTHVQRCVHGQAAPELPPAATETATAPAGTDGRFGLIRSRAHLVPFSALPQVSNPGS